MKALSLFLLSVFTAPLLAGPLDPHYLDSCENSKGQLKAVQQIMATNGGRPLARTSPILNRSVEECFTQPKDVKLSDDEVQQSRGSGGSVGIMRTGLARSRLGSEKMKGRYDRCSQDHDALQQAIKDDRDEMNDHLSERRKSLKEFEEYARSRNMPPAEQQPHLDRFRQQITEIEQDLSKTGQVSSYARDAYRAMVTCYARLQSIYDKAGAEYEQALNDVSADDTAMATGAPPTPAKPIKDMSPEELANLAQDQAKDWAQKKAIAVPIEQGIKQSAQGVARVLATQAPKRILNPIASAISDIVMPDANPGGACSGAPVDDPWKRYNAGCFRVNSIGSAIGILQRP